MSTRRKRELDATKPKRCKGITKSGKPCQSTWLGPDGYCQHHSPGLAGEKAIEPSTDAPLARMPESPEELGKLVRKAIAKGRWTQLSTLGEMQGAAVRKILSGDGACHFDEETAAMLSAEVEGLAAKLYEECQATTVIEQMLVQRIVMSYLRLTLAEHEHSTSIVPGMSLRAREHQLKVLSTASSEFLRNVRALKDIKTVPLKVTIRDAGQVNVGQQQVNVTNPKKMVPDGGSRLEVRDAERSEWGLPDGTQAQEDD